MISERPDAKGAAPSTSATTDPLVADSVTPWLGAISLTIFTIGVIGLLTYTLTDLSWQQGFGGWNYLAGTVLMVGGIVMLRWWHAGTRYGRHA